MRRLQGADLSISRRAFLETTTLGSLAAGSLAAADTKIPTRVLGKTGARVSILAMGGGSRFLLYDEDKAIEAVHKALDLGITYIDTAQQYGQGLSEQRMGKALEDRRDSVFLATKIADRDGQQTQRRIEASLKALRTDHLDLIHIHTLLTAEDLAVIEAKGGVLEQVLKLRDQKVTRFIGITSHYDPEVLKTALERHDFDCTQMALNAGMVGMEQHKMVLDKTVKTSFETVALPVAVRKKMGVIAMKVMGQDYLIGQATPEKLMYYALSLPVTTASIGMPKLDQIEDNVRLAKAFKPLSAREMRELSTTLSQKNKVAMDSFLSHHVDA
jgi:predicted aldo/keto reductase-like oxidoreductase